MSTPAYVDSETITQADGAQSSRVPVPLPDDPYVAVRQAHLVDTDTESDQEEAPSEVEELQSLGSRVPLMGEETARMTIRDQPAMSPGLSASVTEAMALLDLAFRKRYRSSYETPSPSLTLPVRKRYRGTFELILDTNSEGDELGDEDTDEDEEDESLDADDEREREEEAVPEGQQQAVLVVKTTASEPLGLRYGALRHHELAVGEDRVPSTFEVDPEDSMVYTDIPAYVPLSTPVQTPPYLEWLSGSLPISPPSLVVPSPIASPVTTPTATISVDKDHFLEVGAQHVRELYTRSGVVRDEIFLQRCMFRSLEPGRYAACALRDERSCYCFRA
ncbi:hypothetical protein Tco_1078002 [Tanacetum coccineum]